MTERISRRKLLRAGAAALLVAIPFRRLASIGTDAWSTLRSALLKACGSRTVPATLGHACIRRGQMPALARNARDLAASYKRAAVARVDFAAWFEVETVSDFEAGRVVRVDGWVISETEFLLFSSSDYQA
jgi:hypothetical protein